MNDPLSELLNLGAGVLPEEIQSQLKSKQHIQQEQEEFKEEQAHKVHRSKDKIDAAESLLNEIGEDLPGEIKHKLQTASRPIKENIRVSPRNWFGEDYRKEYKHHVNSYKAKTWMEKLLDEINQEIDEELFDAILDTQDNEKARRIVTINQLNKLGKPITDFYRS